MRFFKHLQLRIRAEKIAQGFQKLRDQQFAATLHSIEKQVSPDEVVSRTLAGDADLALKGFQLWVFVAFISTHPYVSEADLQSFVGLVSIAISRTQQDELLAYFRELQECGEDFTDQALSVSLRVANHITLELNPVAAVIATRLIPIFAVNIEMVIADTFGDSKTLKELDAAMDKARLMASGSA